MISSLFGSLNFLTTILNMRCRGLSMGRLPLAIWGIFITAILALLTFPVLMGALGLMLLDRLAGTSFFEPSNLLVGGQISAHQGGDPLLWQHLFWFFGHPEVYILILTPMGIVSEIISTFSRKPIFGYKAMILSLSAIGFLSFLVWGHHMFVSGMHPLLGAVFMGSTILIAVPSAIKTFNWCATLWHGRIHFTTAMLFAIGFVSVFVTGGLSGIFLAIAPVDIYLHDTYFVIAHFHFVMASASLFAILAGTYFWFPKFFGRMMNETLGKIHFALTFLGIYGTFYPMHFIGLHSNDRRLYDNAAYPFLAHTGPIDVFITPQRLPARRGAAHLRVQLLLQPEVRPGRGHEPVARQLAGLADADPAAARQLGRRAPDGLPLAVRLQRAGGEGRLHPADRPSGAGRRGRRRRRGVADAPRGAWTRPTKDR